MRRLIAITDQYRESQAAPVSLPASMLAVMTMTGNSAPGKILVMPLTLK